MNREITTKKVGRQKKLTNPCPVKNTFEAVLYGRLNIPDSPRGLCADLIDVSRTISREFALVEEVFL